MKLSYDRSEVEKAIQRTFESFPYDDPEWHTDHFMEQLCKLSQVKNNRWIKLDIPMCYIEDMVDQFINVEEQIVFFSNLGFKRYCKQFTISIAKSNYNNLKMISSFNNITIEEAIYDILQDVLANKHIVDSFDNCILEEDDYHWIQLELPLFEAVLIAELNKYNFGFTIPDVECEIEIIIDNYLRDY